MSIKWFTARASSSQGARTIGHRLVSVVVNYRAIILSSRDPRLLRYFFFLSFFSLHREKSWRLIRVFMNELRKPRFQYLEAIVYLLFLFFCNVNNASLFVCLFARETNKLFYALSTVFYSSVLKIKYFKFYV